MAEETKMEAEPSEVVDLTMMKNGGVLKEIIRPGTTDESPSSGCKVYVHYTGRLLDGTKFDSSVDRGEKFSFDLGKGQVIKAWDLGVASMKRGEFCKLTCKPDFAYGEKGSPPTIPANATLIFEIELFDWDLEDISDEGDKSIIRRVVKKGRTGFDTPNDGAKVEACIRGYYGEKTFDERELKFCIGEDEAENLPKGVEIALKKMNKAEEAIIEMKARHAFGSEGNEALGVPPNTDVSYEIKLKTFEKAKEIWELSDEEKVEQSEIVKTKGTKYFKAGDLKKAIFQYKRITDYLDSRDGNKSELDVKWNALKLAGHLNLALCYNKTKQFELAVKSCEEALQVDKGSEKAYFRRGEAEFARTNYEEAKSDFMQAKNLNPENKLAQKKLHECNVQLKRQREAEKRTFGGMFEKFARQDEKLEMKRRQMAKDAKKTKNAEKEDEKAAGDSEKDTKGHENAQENGVEAH